MRNQILMGIFLLAALAAAADSAEAAGAECEAPAAVVTGVTHAGCQGEDGYTSVCQGLQCPCRDPDAPQFCRGTDGQDGCAAPVVVTVGDCRGGAGGEGAGTSRGGAGGTGCIGIVTVAAGGCEGGPGGTCQDYPDGGPYGQCQGVGGDGCVSTIVVAADGACRGADGGSGCRGVVVVYDRGSCVSCDYEDGQPTGCQESCHADECVPVCVAQCVNAATRSAAAAASRPGEPVARAALP